MKKKPTGTPIPVLGVIRFYSIDGDPSSLTQFSPHLMSKQCRQNVGNYLIECGEQMKKNKFDDGQQWRRFPLPKKKASK